MNGSFVETIIMPFKENCKSEGEVITKLKLARAHYYRHQSISAVARGVGCHRNTIANIISLCERHMSDEHRKFLHDGAKLHIKDLELFSFLQSHSRAPKTHARALDTETTAIILDEHERCTYGPKRMLKHLVRAKKIEEGVVSFGKMRGVYKRNSLKAKRIRTKNGEVRTLYDYQSLAAFEKNQYDVKYVADQHSLPKDIYDLFKHNPEIPVYQWTFIDAKTKTKFLGYSQWRTSSHGLQFLKYILSWLRTHGIAVHMNVQFDGGSEFCSGSDRKLEDWNTELAPYGCTVTQTDGAFWKQNIVERTHRTDDEEMYCPRGLFMNARDSFMREAAGYQHYFNTQRSHFGKGMGGKTPVEKLESLGYYNAVKIVDLPVVHLDEVFLALRDCFPMMKDGGAQNVLTYYPTTIIVLYSTTN